LGTATAHRREVIATLLFVAASLASERAGSGPALAPVAAPRLGDWVAPPEPGPLERLASAGRLTPTVRAATYDDWLLPHPLIEEAAAALVEGLTPYARGVFVTSVARAPNEQLKLMKDRRFRSWAVDRSKHLLGGYAADIGFVQRRQPMWKLRTLAERELHERLGPQKAKLLRVVSEARCLHIEIDSHHGRELIEARVNALVHWGILKAKPTDQNPVPHLKDYVPEDDWRQRPRRPLEALPG
jgi:hypothetical protein